MDDSTAPARQTQDEADAAVTGSDDRMRRQRESALFACGLLVSLIVLCLLVYRVVFWPEFISPRTGWGTAGRVGVISLAVTALLIGCRWCTLVVLAFLAHRSYRRGAAGFTNWPFVSIFVPSYNEAETIDAALASLIALDYPSYEVLVVNDGSRDNTLERARRYEGRHGGCVVRVYDKPNGGKWSAHNLAFQRSVGELILCLDADSRLDRQALRTLVTRMSDPRVWGVAGQMRVRNRDKLLTRLQGLEYLLANGAVRLGQGWFGTVLIVPGPIGMFRRSVLEEVWLRYTSGQDTSTPGAVAGPFEGNTFAEDFDLSLAVLCLGGRIVYEPAAISLTRAPETLFALINQRYRWVRGAMQVLRKFVQRARRDPHVVSPRLLTWLLATTAVDLTILPLTYYLGLAAMLVVLVTGGNLVLLLGVVGAFLLGQLNVAALFVSVHGDRLNLLRVLPLYGPYSGLLLNSAWVIAAADEVRGAKMRW
jgi:cellulose synthase/poly-beta-1,6-N-acetylglucosamine synthase-like glycosyltransferase